MQLMDCMHGGSVAAFFRNNHFNTLYKHTDGALYVLVTDEGYSNEEGVVWEKLCSEIGDTTYVSAQFEPYGVFQQKQVAEQEEALRQIRLAEEVRSACPCCPCFPCCPCLQGAQCLSIALSILSLLFWRSRLGAFIFMCHAWGVPNFCQFSTFNLVHACCA